MAVILPRHPVGCFTNSSPRAYVPAPSVGQDDSSRPPSLFSVCARASVSVFLSFFLSPSFCLWLCHSPVCTFQSCHGLPLPWTAARLPCPAPQGDHQSKQKNKQCRKRNFKEYSGKRVTSKAGARSPWSSLLQLVRWGERELLNGSQEMEKSERQGAGGGGGGWHKKCSLDIFKLWTLHMHHRYRNNPRLTYGLSALTLAGILLIVPDGGGDSTAE